MRRLLQDQAVFAKSLFVEECCLLELHRREELLVVILIEALDVDAEFLQQSLGGRAVVCRSLDRLRAAVAEQQPVSRAKLVALRMAAKVIVIVEDENL